MSTYEKIQWSEGLSIGNHNVDRDHQKLLKIYNSLVDLITNDGSRIEFVSILSEMTDYALLHFRKEEEYMKAFSYPGFADYEKYHMDYIYRVSMFNIELSRFSTTDPKEVLQYVEQWWIKHILENDLEYENFKKSIQSDAHYAAFWIICYQE